MKYLKHFLPSVFIILALYTFSLGSHYPTIFLAGFSVFIILGDIFLKKQTTVQRFSYPNILNLSIYINLPFLFILLFFVVFIFSNYSPIWVLNLYDDFLFIDLLNIKNSATLVDKISIIISTTLFIGILGTVPGHELTHRKKNKFDMFIGNWLLAFSWDCAFAIEHVYGHHKHVGLAEDPATAKRGEKLYGFILRALYKEQIVAWKIEIARLKRRNHYFLSFHNKMIIGYFRSIIIMILAYSIGGITGMATFLLCAILAKALLETINYSEHYGLVRLKGEPVSTRHSWNSNHAMSGVMLCNVNRHSSHHHSSNLKFWELDTLPEAPMLPHGYLSMIYLAIFLPFLYHRMMAKKLMDWDINYASDEEKKIVSTPTFIL
jgi:alkane 1-monooxygenase